MSQLLDLSNASLLTLVEHSLAAVPPDVEWATLAYDELSRRRARRAINQTNGIFAQAGIKPIPWLDAATKSLGLLEAPAPGVYQGHLYVVLISGFTEQNQFYGAYVGASRYKPETRFQQHKVGLRASGLVRNRGIQVLKSLCWPNEQTVPGGRNIVLWESALNRCLALVIPKVRGDCVPMAEWGDEFQRPLRSIYEILEQVTTGAS